MSAYKKIKSVIKDIELFKSVLDGLGIVYEEGESLPLYGYRGDERPERADLVIRRRNVSSGANDIGWKRTDDGWQAIVSEFDGLRAEDKSTRQHLILRKAMQEYSRRDVIRRYEEAGYIVSEKQRADGSIELEVRRGRSSRIGRDEVTRQERVRVRR